MKIDDKNKIIYHKNFIIECNKINPFEGCEKLIWIGGILFCMMLLAG